MPGDSLFLFPLAQKLYALDVLAQEVAYERERGVTETMHKRLPGRTRSLGGAGS